MDKKSWVYVQETKRRYDSITGEPKEYISESIKDAKSGLTVAYMSLTVPSDGPILAAAPELFDAVKFAAENLDHEGDCPEEGLQTCLRCALDRALLKAKGQTQGEPAQERGQHMRHADGDSSE